VANSASECRRARTFFSDQVEVGFDGFLDEATQIFIEEIDRSLLTLDVDLETSRA
jgi:hypothetical protein